MNFIKMKIFLASLLFFGALNLVEIKTNLNAQSEDKILYLNMEEALSLAIQNNNMVKSNEFALKKANWDIKQAWSQLFPVLSFNTRYNWIDEQTFAERDFRRYLPPELANQFPQTVFQESYYSSFDVSFPLFNGVLLNGLSIAYEQENMTEQISKSTMQQVIFNVITSYLNVLKNIEILKLQNEYLELSKLNFEKAQRLFEANRYSQNEALRWKIEYQQQKSTVVNSEAELRTAYLTLSRLINAELTSETIFEVKIPNYLDEEKNKLLSYDDQKILEIINLNDEQLIDANASLSSLKSNEEISRLLHKNSYSSFMPKINLSYSYGWRENNTLKLDDYSPKNLMVNFNIPLFSGFQNFTALKSTFYEYKKNQEQFKDQLLNTKLTLNNVANNIINIKSQLELLSSNVEFSESNYKIVEKQKEKGLVSNIDYIDAKLNMQNAKISYIGNSFNFIISIVELYYLTGKIEDFIK